jgi:hypothetical protein
MQHLVYNVSLFVSIKACQLLKLFVPTYHLNEEEQNLHVTEPTKAYLHAKVFQAENLLPINNNITTVTDRTLQGPWIGIQTVVKHICSVKT